MVQRHYSPDGALVGITEIESPWTDEARAEAEALVEAEQLVCLICGNLREECSDPTRPWFPQRNVCYATRAQAIADRMYERKNKDQPYIGQDGKVRGKDFTPKTPVHYRDGVRVWASQHDLTPDDDFI